MSCLNQAAKASSPGLQFHALQYILVRISEKDGSAARLAGSVRYTGSLQSLLNGLDAGDPKAGVPVAPSMLRPAIQGIWVWQHHEVDHLRANPQPGAIIWQLVVGPLGVEVQACSMKCQNYQQAWVMQFSLLNSHPGLKFARVDQSLAMLRLGSRMLKAQLLLCKVISVDIAHAAVSRAGKFFSDNKWLTSGCPDFSERSTCCMLPSWL